jgi:hypothetical protein
MNMNNENLWKLPASDALVSAISETHYIMLVPNIFILRHLQIFTVDVFVCFLWSIFCFFSYFLLLFHVEDNKRLPLKIVNVAVQGTKEYFHRTKFLSSLITQSMQYVSMTLKRDRGGEPGR